MNTEKIIRLSIQALSLILVILFFVPTFCVSCAGEDIMTISPSAMATGIEFEGRYYGAVPQMFLFIIMPILALILAVFKSKITSALVALIGLADIGGWMLIRNALEEAVNEYGCTSSANAAFIVDIILSLGIVVLGIVCLIKKPDTPELDPGRGFIPPAMNENNEVAEAEMKHSEEIRENNILYYNFAEDDKDEATIPLQNDVEVSEHIEPVYQPVIPPAENPPAIPNTRVEIHGLTGSKEKKSTETPRGFHKPTEL